jgi:hypothetical protein
MTYMDDDIDSFSLAEENEAEEEKDIEGEESF